MTSKSLEALEKLYDGYQYGMAGRSFYDLIKQDLERKEVLELNLDSEKYNLVNENQCLKNRVEDLEISYKQLEKENQKLKEPKYKVLMGCRGGRKQFAQLVEILKNENQDLKDKLNSEALDNWQLHCKYGKYKKAIDILKNKLHIEFDDKYNEISFEVSGSTEIDYVYFSLDNKQEYELLKEMLSDDK